MYDYDDNITELAGSNTINATVLGEVGEAASENLTPTSEDWFYNFYVNRPYSLGYDLSPHFVNIDFVSIDATAISVRIEPYIYPGMISKYVKLNDVEYTFVHDNKSFTIQQKVNKLSIVHDSEIILPLSGVGYTNPTTATLRIEADLLNKPFLADNLVSYCGATVAKIEDDGYMSEEYLPSGGYYDASHDKVQFYVNGEYKLSGTTYLEYAIYDVNRTLVAGVSENGATVVGSAPLLIKQKDSNGYIIDLSGISLSAGAYVLEVKTEKEEVMIIRFNK